MFLNEITKNNKTLFVLVASHPAHIKVLCICVVAKPHKYMLYYPALLGSTCSVTASWKCGESLGFIDIAKEVKHV